MKITNLLTAKVVDTAYDVTYVFPAVDFGGGSDIEEIVQAPAGFQGVVRAVSVYDVTEIFTAVTVEARVDVGVAGGTADAYAGSADFGALAAAASLSPELVIGGGISPGASIGVNMIATTGGVPTGIATVAVTITWFK